MALAHLLVDVAPQPALVGLCGGYYRMSGLVEVLGGMTVLGRIAASNMAASKACAQMHPNVSKRNALLADMDFGCRIMAACQMFAR